MQHPVTHIVPEQVIDLFKVIDIDEDNTQRAVFPVGPLNRSVSGSRIACSRRVSFNRNFASARAMCSETVIASCCSEGGIPFSSPSSINDLIRVIVPNASPCAIIGMHRCE